jgi:2-polyprenyl-3-methyl-5-hydroxy-6-metoxy-1,4-benzoquinol methylase
MPDFKEVDIDEVRQYWNRRPCNVRHSPAAVGTVDYFDQVEARKYLVEPHIPLFADFPRWAGKRVLEVGCGIGTDTINFARAGADVTAVDLSDRSLDLAAQRAEAFNLADRVRFVRADAERLTEFLEPSEFDLVYSFGVIHHSPHPERIIQQLREFVTPKSLLKLMVYNRYSWKVMQILMRGAPASFRSIDAYVARSSEAESGCPVTYTYSKKSVAQLLRGFDVTDAFVDHIFPYRVADYVDYRYVKTRIARLSPSPLWRCLERSLGWHLCVTARVRA